MPALNARASVVAATSNTTWSTTTNAIDGAFGVNNATYSVWTNTTANAVGYIELGFGTQFSAIPAGAIINSVQVSVRNLVSNTSRIASATFQPFDGTTAIGTPANIVRSTTASTDTANFTPTLAQLKSANFKIRTTATRFNGTQAGTFSIDYIDVVVNYTIPPVASFTANQTTIQAGQSVQFTDTSTNSPTGWTWNFGTGGPANSTVQNPLVTFPVPGTYQVTLTASNAAGSNASSPTTITVNMPTVDAAMSITSTGPYVAGVTPVEVNYGASVVGTTTAGDGDATLDWGDGTTAHTRAYSWELGGGWNGPPTASHVYAAPGNYTMTLTVRRTAPVPQTDVTTLPVTVTVVANPLSSFTDDFASGMTKWAGGQYGFSTASGRAEATVPGTAMYNWARTAGEGAENLIAADTTLVWQMSAAAWADGREQQMGIYRGEQGSGRSGLMILQNGDYVLVRGYNNDAFTNYGEVNGVPLTQWWRAVFTTTTVTVSRSDDGFTWTQVGTGAWAPGSSPVRLELAVGAWQVAGTFTGWFDNINLPPTVVPGQVFNGTSWQAPEVWNGTRWVPPSQVEVFNGTAWVPMGGA